MEKPQCLKNKTGLFGRKYQEYEHKWAYKNKEERQCVYCKRKEIFFGYRKGVDYMLEDWRRKL